MKIQNYIILIVLLSASQYLYAGLIAWWPLDEIEEPGVNELWVVSEATGNYGDAAVIGWVDIGTTEGPLGGVDRAIRTYPRLAPATQGAINTGSATVIPASGDFTAIVWMKTHGRHPNNGNLLSNNKLGINSRLDLKVFDGKAMMWCNLFGAVDSGVAVDDCDWHQIGMSRKDKRYYLIVDGVFKGSAYSSSPLDTVWEWTIGRARSNDFSFDGYISDVKIYDNALNEIDIAENYYQVLKIKPCVESFKPLYDYNNDCITDVDDVKIWVSSWLETGLYPDCLQYN